MMLEILRFPGYVLPMAETNTSINTMQTERKLTPRQCPSRQQRLLSLLETTVTPCPCLNEKRRCPSRAHTRSMHGTGPVPPFGDTSFSSRIPTEAVQIACRKQANEAIPYVQLSSGHRKLDKSEEHAVIHFVTFLRTLLYTA